MQTSHSQLQPLGMTKPIDDFKDYVVADVLGHVADITARRMFGGYGLYHQRRIFAIITSDTELYFKADASNQAEYEAAGGTQFIYTGHTNKKPTAMPYWRVPEQIMEDRDTIERWVHTSAALSEPKT